MEKFLQEFKTKTKVDVKEVNINDFFNKLSNKECKFDVKFICDECTETDECDCVNYVKEQNVIYKACGTEQQIKKLKNLYSMNVMYRILLAP